MITNLVILAFFVGLLTVPVAIGAIEWSKHLGLKMTWWKWCLLALWYVLFLFLVLAAFTFMGEGGRRKLQSLVLRCGHWSTSTVGASCKQQKSKDEGYIGAFVEHLPKPPLELG